MSYPTYTDNKVKLYSKRGKRRKRLCLWYFLLFDYLLSVRGYFQSTSLAIMINEEQIVMHMSPIKGVSISATPWIATSPWYFSFVCLLL